MTARPHRRSRGAAVLPLLGALACGCGGPGGTGGLPGADGGGGRGADAGGGSDSGARDASAGGESGAPGARDGEASAPGDASGSGDASGADGQGAAPPSAILPPPCKTDISAQIVANTNIVLTGDSCIVLPPGTTEYDGVITGVGTLALSAPAGPATLVVTGDSTFTLPASQHTETATQTANYYTIRAPDPPAVFIEPNATLQLGTFTSTGGSIASNLPGTGTAIINADNIEVDGTLAMGGGPTEHFGILGGTGLITQPGNPGPYAPGTFYLVGDDTFSGLLSILTGGQVGDLGIEFSLPFARTIVSDGSMIMNSPPGLGYTLPQSIYEDHYGDDINTDHGIITFTGVYSYSDSADGLHPSLSDPSLNTSVVTNTGASPTHVNGSNASFRGINLEGGITQWGDGTTSTFFLPSSPAPADPGAKNVKNAYINVHNNGTNAGLIFNYNGKYTCNIGITGGGRGPDATGAVGSGNLTIAATPGNDAVLTMPQNYNGTTTIGAGATLQLGNGAPVQAMGVTIGAPTAAEPKGAATTTVLATYSGDSSLLVAESPGGASTDQIIDDGTLVVDNTTTAVSLSNVSGTGALVQLGSAAVTLLANGYTGGTTIRQGLVVVGSDTSLGTGSVVDDAGLTTASGQHLVHVGGDYEQGASGTLTLGLGGAGQGVGYDYVSVAGKATLAGTLAVNAVGGFAPAVGQVFTVLVAAGGVTGAFAAVTSPAIKLAATYDATHCYLTVTP